jgi:hypothetical protein
MVAEEELVQEESTRSRVCGEQRVLAVAQRWFCAAE